MPNNSRKKIINVKEKKIEYKIIRIPESDNLISRTNNFQSYNIKNDSEIKFVINLKIMCVDVNTNTNTNTKEVSIIDLYQINFKWKIYLIWNV